MSTRTSFKPVEVQVVYGGCGHVLRKTQVIPIQVSTGGETSKTKKRTSSTSSNTSKSSRRSSWKSFLCAGAEQAESDSDNETDLVFQCAGLELVDNIDGLCPDCTTRQSRLLVQQQARGAEIIRAQIAQEQDDERERQRRGYRRMEDRRTKFRCGKCIKEDRHPIDRSANDGFCCEFGQSFWNAKIPDAEHFSVPTAEMKRMTVGKSEARHAATKAANSYGWKSQPDRFNRIEPEVISQFIGIPGSQPASLPAPVVPRYEDANLDIDRWNSQVRTYRGTVPAPNKPLPPTPLTRKPRATPVRKNPTAGRKEADEIIPLKTKDSDVSVMTSLTKSGEVSPVSPTNSHWPSSLSRPSSVTRPKTQDGEYNLRRQMSNLEHEIDGALESWTQEETEPLPQERRRRR
ncbi:uncharacterized protein EAF01_000719 [Botrytis porri]|uniref:Stc1 domain-containing protein n=1 Tax=Botrytis porri TaxID=87229 RepID=A0A4Z1L483_9HELO|nr:uncharacterized protein EAF01_000719 [Botrytis porri]KAF7914313.1 hypothetical protein EAF01_000719 [Botrytis porri]TGO91601.1 hypothetical protein BPOR_0023g00260 [Botrytis porri]